MRHPEQRVTEPKDLGILMNMNLQKIKLGEVCRFINGRAYSQPELLDSGKYKVLRVGNIFEGNHWYYSDMELDDDKYCNEGDLLYSWACTFGPYIWHGPKTIYHYHIWKVEPNQSLVDKHFLYYFLNHQTKGFMGSTHGSTMIHITKENMENFEVLLPSLSDQKKIASVLSALDDKIALNKKMNQKLEAMAKRLYDYWFVQYDFPDKNGHPYKTTGGPMTYNPTLKREIPVGWEVAPISEFIEKNFNGEWGKEEASEDDIRVHCVRGADIVDMVDMPVRYISTKKKDRILNPNDIIVEISGGSPTQSTGRATFVTRNTLNRFDSPMTCSNFCQIIRLKDAKCASYFFEMWQKFYASDIFFNFEGKTSGIKNFQTDSFIATPWAHPPKELMYKFDEMYQSFMKKKQRLIAENQKLTTLRDKLLPLLMNGQVVVG